MNIAWFSWKDINHPLAGGAESISWRIMQRLAKEGHQVRLVTARYSDSTEHEIIDGVEIFRTGNRWGVYPKAVFLFRKKFADWPDLLVDEMNTIPFAVGFFSRKPRVLLAYQLARKVWFSQMFFPLSVIGYWLEPVYLFVMSRRYHRVLTESESSRQDFSGYGFSLENTKVFRVGIDLKPLETLPIKPSMHEVLILGAVRPMKQTLSAVKGFEYARDVNPKLKLTIAGDVSDPYAAKVTRYISQSRHSGAINVLGRVSAKDRLKLMRQTNVILVTSIKEGWGLIVTEANSQGTPAITFDTDGLRDSVKDKKTGTLVSPGDEVGLGQAIVEMLSDKVAYTALCKAALLDSKQYTFDNAYDDFIAGAGITSRD